MKILQGIVLAIFIGLYEWMNIFVADTFSRAIEEAMGIDIRIVLIIIFTLITVITLLIYGVEKINLGKVLGKVGIYAFGFSIISFFLILITNLIGGIIEVDNLKYFGLVQLGIIILVFAYGRYNASKVKIKNYNIKINKKSQLKGLKVILISDLHLGYFNDNNKLRKNVEKINRENPDVVLIPGDLFDGGFVGLQDKRTTREIFNSIKSTYGTFLSWGNHDAGESFNNMKSFIESTNIELLEDREVYIENKFSIIGRKDSRPIGNQGEIREKIWKEFSREDLPIIVLEHQEPNFDEYKDADLIVSGHTHKGQIFPFNIVTGLYFKNHYGHLTLESGLQSITTSGLGTWGPPLRIGSNNEIVSINIEFN